MTKPQIALIPYYDTKNKYEICIDEVGRGPLFGSVYVAGVILPVGIQENGCIDNGFNGTGIKDSKKFSSKKKITAMSSYIKEQVLAWHIAAVDAKTIDDVNILQAVYKGMHECIRALIDQLVQRNPNINVVNDIFVVIDGDRFKPYYIYDNDKQFMTEIQYATVEQGDAKYMGIAAASIIAKVARDEYISDLCERHPELCERYKLDNNMGYGTKHHIEGIQTYGITQWHRKSFNICKGALYSPL